MLLHENIDYNQMYNLILTMMTNFELFRPLRMFRTEINNIC